MRNETVFPVSRFGQCIGSSLYPVRDLQSDRIYGRVNMESSVQKTNIRATSADGMAALSICESLLLALTDLKLVSEEDARSLLTDVVTTHAEAVETSPTPERHQAVVEIVHRILAGKNGVRH